MNRTIENMRLILDTLARKAKAYEKTALQLAKAIQSMEDLERIDPEIVKELDETQPSDPPSWLDLAERKQ